MVKAAAEPVSQAVTPEAMTKVATGFMAAKHLFTASGLGLFAQLGGGPLPLAQLAERCGIPARSARILADAMVALGFVEKAEAWYANRPVAQSFLAGDPEDGLRPFLSFWDQISYPAWMNLEDATRTGTGVGLQLNEAQQRVFSAGVQALTAGAARSLAGGYDLGRHHRLLDVGGGTGSFLVAMLSVHSRLEGTLFELPAVAGVARHLVTGTSVADRITVVEGDFLRDQVPSGHDVLLLANVIHLFQPGQPRAAGEVAEGRRGGRQSAPGGLLDRPQPYPAPVRRADGGRVLGHRGRRRLQCRRGAGLAGRNGLDDG